MSDTEEKSPVSFSEAIEIKGKRVGEFIVSKAPGLILSSPVGYEPHGPHETKAYGFLLEGPKKSQLTRLKETFFATARRPRIGILWMSEPMRKATHKEWVLEVFGRHHVEFFTKLAKQLSNEFKVKIHIRLESEQEEYEYKTKDD